MDTQPEPIRRSSLPTTPPPEWEFHTWFPRPDGGGDLVPGQLARGVQVRRRVTYGDWEPVQPDRWADEPPTDARSAIEPEPDFGIDGCTCRPFTHQGGTRYLDQPGDTVDMIGGWEIGDCPHHKRRTAPAVGEQHHA